ncbi:MAG: ABC transporter ATP-binding protein [Phycisphaerales bacterium]|nr:ABC transporter ATP-binding protein [Phycisphaerales bacterium]
MNYDQHARTGKHGQASTLARATRESECGGPLLQVAGLTFGYDASPAFLGPLDFDVSRGSMLAVVGPNGAGKSTLLRLTVGLLTARGGTISLRQCPIERMTHRQRASTVAFLPQSLSAPPDLSARQVVLLGRYPRRGFRWFESNADHRAADRCMDVTHTLAFADRRLDTLSAGERQRVHLAAALAQEPELLILDEPTAALDPYYQLEVFGLLRWLCSERGLTVVVVTHDLNLAGQRCDAVLLLANGRAAAYGSPAESLRPDVLASVYGVRFEIASLARDGRPWLLPVETVEKKAR